MDSARGIWGGFGHLCRLWLDRWLALKMKGKSMFVPKISEWKGRTQAWARKAKAPTATTASSSRKNRTISGAKTKTRTAETVITLALTFTRKE